jgi:hypothetical protein
MNTTWLVHSINCHLGQYFLYFFTLRFFLSHAHTEHHWRCFNQIGDDTHEALTKFDYKLNMKAILKKHSFIFFTIFYILYSNLV